MASKTIVFNTQEKELIHGTTSSGKYIQLFDSNAENLVKQNIPRWSHITQANLFLEIRDDYSWITTNASYNIIYGPFGTEEFTTGSETNYNTHNLSILGGMDDGITAEEDDKGNRKSYAGYPQKRTEGLSSATRFLGIKARTTVVGSNTDVWMRGFQIAYEFTYPTYQINLSVTSIKNNKNESLIPGTTSSSNFTSGTAFDITTSDKTVTMTATPSNGYTFSHWTLNGENVSNTATLSLTLNDEKIGANATTVNYVANFTRNNYTVSTTSNNSSWGSTKIKYNNIEGNSSQTLPYGDKVELVAIPKTGYYFDKWEGTNITNPTMEVIVGTSGNTYTAIFKKYRTVDVSVEVDRARIGEVTLTQSAPSDGNGNSQWYRVNETISLNVSRIGGPPIPDSHDFAWYVNGQEISKDPSTTFQFSDESVENYSIVAKYNIKTYRIAPEINNLDYGIVEIEYTTPHEGNVNEREDGIYYDYGTEIQFKAVVNNAKAFTKWKYQSRNSDGTLFQEVVFYEKTLPSFLAQDFGKAIAIFRKTYVTYDSLFSLPRWIDTGITSSSASVLLGQDNSQIGLEVNGSSGTSLFTLPIKVEVGKRYHFSCQVLDEVIFNIIIREQNTPHDPNDTPNDPNAFIYSFNSKDFWFTPVKDYVSFAIELDAGKHYFSNFVLHEDNEGHSSAFMDSTLPPSLRSNDTSWVIPAPSRAGHRFIGWYNSPWDEGTIDNRVFPPGITSGTDNVPFPTDEDWVLYSHWENVNVVRFRIARSNVNLIFPNKTYPKGQM